MPASPPPIPSPAPSAKGAAPADTQLRIRAALLDNLFSLVLVIVVVGSVGYSLAQLEGNHPARSPNDDLPVLYYLIVFAGLTFTTVATYFGLTVSSAKHATWGQRIAGLEVVDDQTGATPSKGQAWSWGLLQAFTRCSGLGLVAYLPILSHPRRQSLLDSLTHLRVVHRNKE